jgi:anaerobic magnesium-protoporphyrin IX monomethyl ester cyclase
VKVLLVQPPPVEDVVKEYISAQIPINLGYIAASLEQVGAEVRIRDYAVQPFDKFSFLEEIHHFKPTIIGFTSMTNAISSADKLSKYVKDFNKDIVTVLGGCHASALPIETLEEIESIDIVVIGEGDETIKEVYHKIGGGKSLEDVMGIAYRDDGRIKVNQKRELIKNLDDIPLPAWHLFNMKLYEKSHVSRGFSRKHIKMMELMTSRGCPFSCIFCAGHINYGRKVRFRTFENIKREIELCMKEYGVSHISVEDDTLSLNKGLLVQLCEYFKEMKLTWNCNARVDSVDYELLKLMSESGCQKISFGVESGSPRILKLIKKGISLEQVKSAFEWAKKVGIKYVDGTFILGSHPDETLEEIEMTKKLIFELKPDFVSVSIMCPFPGTEVYDVMKKSELLPDKPDWSSFVFLGKNTPYNRLNHLTSSELMKLQNDIISGYYSSFNYIKNRVIRVRSIGELMYFVKLGTIFFKKFVLAKAFR